jgi:hypothetical protein
MHKKLTMLAVVPGGDCYTAYFYSHDKKIVLPVNVIDSCVHEIMKIEQSLLFSLYSLFIPENSVKLNVKVELEIDEVLINTLGIKITKELLDRSTSDVKQK